jgi:hypothetical protein
MLNKPVDKIARREVIEAPETKKRAKPEEMMITAVPKSGSSMIRNKTTKEIKKKRKKFLFLEKRVDK